MPKKSRVPTGEDQIPSDETQDNSYDTLNSQFSRGKIKSERSKKKSRQSERTSNRKAKKVSGKRGKSNGRKKSNRKEKSKMDKHEELRKLEGYDLAREMSMTGMEGEVLKQKEDKLKYLESIRPKRDMDENLIQRIMTMNTLGNDKDVFDQMMDDLNEKKRQALEQPEDFTKYQLGKNMYYDRDIYDTITLFKSKEDKLMIYMEKNLEAFKEIHKKLYEHLKSLGKRENEYSEEYSNDELIKQEILSQLIEPWGEYLVNSPYYYGTKELRSVYNENDAQKYDTMGRDFMETMAMIYGGDLEKVPKLLPLTEEELLEEWVDPEYLSIHNYDEEKKKEIKDYYLKSYNDKVLFERFGDQGGIFGSNWVGIEELLKDINDYYDGPTISGCVKLKQNMYDRVSKQLNKVGLFGERHLAYCADNLLLTEVYLREFEKLPNEFILGPHTNFQDIFSSGKYFTDKIYRYFPECLYEEMKVILNSMGLYVNRASFNYVLPFGEYGRRYINITPTNSLYLLAMVFKTMEPNDEIFLDKNDLFGLSFDRNWNDIGVMINSGNGQSGIEKLRIFLDNLETSYNEIKNGREIYNLDGNRVSSYLPEIFSDNIEITKRFFILLLIGLSDNSMSVNYKTKLNYLEEKLYDAVFKAENENGDIKYDKGKEKKIGSYQRAKNDNIIVEGKWKLQLCKDMNELNEYFVSKLY